MFCALTLAGMNRPSRLFFSPARLADKRPPEPASCQSPLPEDEERIPRLWTPHLLLRAYLGDSAALLSGDWSNGGWNKFHLAYRLLIYKGSSP